MKIVHSSQFIVHSKEKSIRKSLTVNRSGQMLVIAVIFITVALVLTTSLFSRLAAFLKFGSNSILREQALNVAEAGIDNALWQLNKTAGAYTGESNTQVGSTGTFTVTVTNKNANVKIITATGYIPNNTNPRAKKTIKANAVINTSTIAFHYAVQSENGGVNMANSSTINGSLYSNASITGSGSSTINGDAYAVGTISSPDPTVTGTKHPNASPAPVPTVDYQYWKNAAAAGGSPIICSPSCTISNNTTIGPKEYIGDLYITNNAIVTMEGPVWVAKDSFGNGGNFFMQQGGTTLQLDNNFGSDSTVLIIDGNADLTQGGSFLSTNADPKGYIMLVSTSTDSQAIQISQSGATAIFYALDGGAVLSQKAHVTALIANALQMTQNSRLDYDSGLASAEFSAGPGGSWQLQKGSYFFSP